MSTAAIQESCCARTRRDGGGKPSRSEEKQKNPDARERDHATLIVNRQDDFFAKKREGGGIRGVLSLEILADMERLLIKQSGDPNYRLADYFDYVSGTSTGGIIAAGIAMGMS